ncbi:MAG: spermidine/putrescine ABC transporter substrate-binding protein [Bacilli bacterium]|nr:spermidine/putrescine ABC transporter substrate-binding protein [Bacilli bacterium]
MKKYKFILLLFVLLFCGCEKSTHYNGVVNVLNWSSYIPDSVLRSFEEEYNIKVNYGTYSSNEELLAKISSSKEGTYDVIFPSDYMTQLLIEKGLLQKIDISKISNYKNIDNVFLNKDYDPGNDYSLPFLTTIVVIAVNKDNVTDRISSYNDLLSEKYRNNIVLIDDQRIIIGMSLLANGYDMNSVSEDELNKAKDWLLKLKSNVKAYDSDSPKSFFITEEADIGVMWHAEAEIAKEENPNIEIVYPNEGHAISTDNYTIVKGAKNVDNAYLFINYLLRNEVSSLITDEYPYISPNNIVQKSKINEELIFNNGYYVQNIGFDIKKYDKIWADIK